MQYKTIILELLQQTRRYDQLRKDRKLLPTMERYARELKTSHEAWKELLSHEAGQRPEPDRERSPGDSAQGAGGAFALRVSAGRERAAFPRRGHAVPPPSHVARLRTHAASRRCLIPFPTIPLLPIRPRPGPSDGTVISPPGRASGNRFPLKVSPNFPLARSLRERSPG